MGRVRNLHPCGQRSAGSTRSWPWTRLQVLHLEAQVVAQALREARRRLAKPPRPINLESGRAERCSNWRSRQHAFEWYERRRCEGRHSASS
eukprot:6954505-Prymnesium_polylepis.1